MKIPLSLSRKFLLLGLSFIGISANAQDYSVYYHGKKITYGIATDQLVVKFKDKLSLERLQMKPEELSPIVLRLHGGGAKPEIALVDLKPGTAKEKVEETIKALKARPDVIYTSPVLTAKGDSARAAVTDEFVVQIKPGTNISAVIALARQLGATLKHQYQFDSRTYFFSVDKKYDVFTLANSFYESGLFEYAEPNYIDFSILQSADPMFDAQWALRNIGQYGPYGGLAAAGADMGVTRAWDIPGNCRGAGIKVAVIDNGVQLNHPDLAANMDPGYDATHLGSAGGPEQNIAQDAHGTACAGIIAAVADNGIGVAGVAPNAHIVPIRIKYGSYTFIDQVTEGFDWAWTNNRADIISCSFKTSTYSQQLEAAIQRAVTLGRYYNGQALGCVVLFASGNTVQNDPSTALRYPASLSYVIAVGASTLCDRRKRKDYEDCSGETNWGSCYGTGLDVVAPGVKIPTTDLTGVSGFNSGGTHPDYTDDFNGTSAACPNAAGVMALILSAAPNLTQSNARQILESTAAKVHSNGNPYYYNNNVTGQPNGSWNVDVGYGRVDAYAALASITPKLYSNQPALGHLCASSNSYSPYYTLNSSVGYTATWTSSNPSLATIDASSGSVTVNTQGQEGYTVIAGTYSTYCGPKTISQTVYVGDLANVVQGIYRTDDYFCDRGVLQYYVSGLDNSSGITYEWSVNGQASGSGYGMYLDVAPYDNGGTANYTVNLIVHGSCGTYTLSTQESIDTYQMRTNMGCPGLQVQYAFYPNPTASELSVVAMEKPVSGAMVNASSSVSKSSKNRVSPPFEAKLYDSYGKLAGTGKSDGGKIVFNVLKLPNGLYTVRVGTGKAATSRRIQIVH